MEFDIQYESDKIFKADISVAKFSEKIRDALANGENPVVVCGPWSTPWCRLEILQLVNSFCIHHKDETAPSSIREVTSLFDKNNIPPWYSNFFDVSKLYSRFY